VNFTTFYGNTNQFDKGIEEVKTFLSKVVKFTKECKYCNDNFYAPYDDTTCLECSIIEQSGKYTLEDCSICLNKYHRGYKLPRCGHTFHSSCFKKFFASGGDKCPMCRGEIDLSVSFVRVDDSDDDDANDEDWAY
jgi:hypothetical protein